MIRTNTTCFNCSTVLVSDPLPSECSKQAKIDLNVAAYSLVVNPDTSIVLNSSLQNVAVNWVIANFKNYSTHFKQ